ncbi:sensor histidine kinase [Lysobacter arenosi]|uniref:histidine kinase n=1 Tax=Lysobacter arenosi TaxID=2795387 RepID=A0ABX7R7X1_9GAMM|nr:ATP-binding protein [Lysobacter arenosi]QSX73501.1 sensor histidine kinase [Lysobacter arenosi]
MFTRFRHWLTSAPIADAVDRRNAPVMQLLLLAYAVLQPAAWVWQVLQQPQYQAYIMGFVGRLAVETAFAWISIWLIRRGRFRLAIVLFLAPQLILLATDMARLGTRQNVSLYDATATMLPLVIAGLVLGRRALWSVLGMLAVAFALGFWADHKAGVTSDRLKAVIPSICISYLLITAILDRTINALRESLAESNERGERLQHEMAERERTQSQLIHAQKMEASGRLANGVAHDFNNLLALMRGYASQRHEALEDADTSRRSASLALALERVESVADRGSDLVRKLLSFSRSDVLNVRVFDAGEALKDLDPLLRQLFPASIVLTTSVSEPLPVYLDRSEFDLMILNIAANARDAMPQGGRFTVDAAPADGMVEITLSDTGQGMTSEVAARIFEPFFTTRLGAGGTGLGLSVVHDLVKVLGGEILVSSQPGQGTSFSIRLPHANAATSPTLASIP